MGKGAYSYQKALTYLIDTCQGKEGYQEAMRILNSGKDIIEDFEKNPTRLLECGFNYSRTIGCMREAYICKYGFVVVTKRMLREFAKIIGNDKVLEVMSGTGYLAYGLQQEGIRVIATDNLSWRENVFHDFTPWTEIENMDALDAIWKYSKDPEVKWVLMSWPPYQEDTAYHILQTLEDINMNLRPDNPINLIYIGEDWGGCTADDNFFECLPNSENQDSNYWHLDEDFLERAMYENIEGRPEGFFRQFNGIHDEPYVYRWAKHKADNMQPSGGDDAERSPVDWPETYRTGFLQVQ